MIGVHNKKTTPCKMHGVAKVQGGDTPEGVSRDPAKGGNTETAQDQYRQSGNRLQGVASI